MTSTVIHLFGKTGTGKSWIAALLSREFGYFVYEADADFTKRMRDATARGETFTDDMRDEFYSIVARCANELSVRHGVIVLPQATYKNKHREFLRKNIRGYLGIHVTAPSEVVNSRLIQRGDEVTPEYARRVASFYEEPDTDTFSIVNDEGEGKVLGQFSQLKALWLDFL